MPRRYELKRRAELQEKTRRKIVEAAVALHESKGVAATTVTEIAERAGVGRLTVYRHFPDDLALGMACSGLYWERNPPPDPARWKKIADPAGRLEQALMESYAYHARTEKMISKAFDDVGESPIMEPYHEHWRRCAQVAASAWRLRGRRRMLLLAAVGHAIVFPTWQSLVRAQGLTRTEAVRVMMRLVCDCNGRGAGTGPRSSR